MGRNGRNLTIEVGRMVVPSEPVPQQKDSTLFINRGSAWPWPLSCTRANFCIEVTKHSRVLDAS